MAFEEIDGEKRFGGQSPLPLARDLRQTAWDALCERYQFWRYLGGFPTPLLLPGRTIPPRWTFQSAR